MKTLNKVFSGSFLLVKFFGATALAGDQCILEEHVLVPKNGIDKEGAAWLVGAGFNVPKQQSFATVCDGQNLAIGPVALARVPYWLQQCFHGNFYSVT